MVMGTYLETQAIRSNIALQNKMNIFYNAMLFIYFMVFHCSIFVVSFHVLCTALPLLYFYRESDRIRQEEYEKELEEIRRRVDLRPMLFEEESKVP